MIGTRIEVVYRKETGLGTAQVEVTHYAIGRVARWARANGMVGLSPSSDDFAETVLFLQVACWAEQTRGMVDGPGFDEWVATVDDFNPVESDPVDPTQPAT